MTEEEQNERKKNRYKTFSEEIPPEDKAYIVVKGRPSAWYDHGNGANSLVHAEEEAARKAEEEQCEYTVMVVPVASLDMALVAKYHGVVMHALDKLEADDER